MVEILPLLLCHWPPLLECSLRLSLAVLPLGKAHEDSDHTAMIAVIHAETHPCWQSCECCNTFFVFPLAAITSN